MIIGMVGLDTSHCVAFTRLLNDPHQEFHVPGGTVTVAYAGGSPQFSLSRDRVAGFSDDLSQQYGVELVETIEEVALAADAILLESSDGRQHLEQFRHLAVGKPVFIDKPFATSTRDAQTMVRIAKETETPLMSSSSLRFAAGVADLVPPGESVEACEAFGRAVLLDDYPGLFWYGVHSAEVLFAMMGPGCRTVRCMAYPDLDLVVGEWSDGRVGSLRGTRLTQGDFGCVVHTNIATRVGLALSVPPYYQLMLQRVIDFFETGDSPIDLAETVGITAFLEGAEASRAQGGQVVSAAV